MTRISVARLSLCAALLAAPTIASAWWNPEWTTRTKVTLNTSPQGLETKEVVNGLVVPVRLHSGIFDFTAAKEDGSDLRVLAADDKTPLKFSVERYDGVNELAVLWVQLPTLLPGTDKNLLHVYAGNPKVAAEPSAVVFGTDTLSLHFAEAEGAAADTTGALRSAQPVLREPNGLLGGSARLAGEPISWPAGERLKLSAGGATTLAFWVKPDNPKQGTLLEWGPLKVSLLDGQVQFAVGSAKSAGGSLPPGAWAHVALALDAGKASVYVNGAPAATFDAAAPAIDAPLSMGAGLGGLLDEVQIVSGARSAD